MPVPKHVDAAFTTPNKVQLIRAGSQYFELLLHLISEAQESIHLQVYIFDTDETGKLVGAALMKAAVRKVRVYVLVDGYASRGLEESFIKELEESGIHFRFFEPIFKSRYFYFGRRLHHKLFVADEKHALVGGINIGNRYNDLPGKPAWLDFALYIQGAIVPQLCTLCWKTWKGFQPGIASVPCKKMRFETEIKSDKNTMVRMRRNDWVQRKNQVSSTYIAMLRNASSHVTILCSYFLPGRIIRKNIIRAIKRGVKIKVIMTGFSDVKIAKNAERYMYDWLLRNKVEIYEYQNNVLHGKVAVADDEWMTIGSYNVNDISAYASIELNLDVKNAVFAKEMEGALDDIIKRSCIQITREQQLLNKNLFSQFIRWYSYQFFRFTFFLITFYFRERT